MRDRISNVPIPVGKIQTTIQDLPRNPPSSGLIGIKFKRKKNYKNTHKHQLVDVDRLIKGLEYLTQYHSSYQGSTIDSDFIERCKQQDPHGYEFFIHNNGDGNENAANDNSDMNTADTIQPEEHTDLLDDDNEPMDNLEDDTQSGSDNEMDAQDKEYDEYVKEGPVRRFQFNYDENVAMANDYLEAETDGNVVIQKDPADVNLNNYANVAPGEGQIPTSILRQKGWDIDTYPNLFSDSKMLFMQTGLTPIHLIKCTLNSAYST